jgi:sugar-specific transcriptional regulator TrmB
MSNMDFKELGLNETESRIINTLIRIRKASASQISKESKVSYGRIYEILETMEVKGLVRVVPEETKMFTICDMKILKDMIDKKQKKLNEIKKDMKQIRNVHRKTPDVLSIARGRKNFHKIMNELNTFPSRFSYTVKHSLDTNPLFIKRETANIKKWKTDIKTLAPLNKETEKNLIKWKKVHKNFRKIENSGIAMGILEGVVFVTLIKDNTTFLVKSKEFSDVMKQMFIKTYENSEKI